MVIMFPWDLRKKLGDGDDSLDVPAPFSTSAKWDK
jgi:hypothetical protein